MKNTKNIESYLPVFTGFYETIFQADEEQVIESPYKYDDYDFDYTGYQIQVAKECCDAIENKLEDIGNFDIKIKYQDIISTKYYNFANDTVNVKYILSKNSSKEIDKYLSYHIDAFTNYIKDHYTSRDGFNSSYSNDVIVWLNEYLNDSQQLSHVFGSILEFILTNEKYSDYDLYGDISGNIYLEATLIDGIKEANETINTYTLDNYGILQPEIIVNDLMNKFEETEICYHCEFLTFKYVKDIVYEVFKNIDDNTLNIFDPQNENIKIE